MSIYICLPMYICIPIKMKMKSHHYKNQEKITLVNQSPDTFPFLHDRRAHVLRCTPLLSVNGGRKSGEQESPLAVMRSDEPEVM